VVEHDRTPEKSAISANFVHKSEDLYCICKQPETADMIGCDDCDNWFHPKCLEKLKIDIS
jgi:COMPASS component SPP1